MNQKKKINKQKKEKNKGGEVGSLEELLKIVSLWLYRRQSQGFSKYVLFKMGKYISNNMWLNYIVKYLV